LGFGSTGKRPYVLSAKVQENSLVMQFLFRCLLKKYWSKNSRVALYFAAGFASGAVVIRQGPFRRDKKARGAFKNQDLGSFLDDFL